MAPLGDPFESNLGNFGKIIRKGQRLEEERVRTRVDVSCREGRTQNPILPGGNCSEQILRAEGRRKHCFFFDNRSNWIKGCVRSIQPLPRLEGNLIWTLELNAPGSRFYIEVRPLNQFYAWEGVSRIIGSVNEEEMELLARKNGEDSLE